MPVFYAPIWEDLFILHIEQTLWFCLSNGKETLLDKHVSHLTFHNNVQSQTMNTKFYIARLRPRSILSLDSKNIGLHFSPGIHMNHSHETVNII